VGLHNPDFGEFTGEKQGKKILGNLKFSLKILPGKVDKTGEKRHIRRNLPQIPGSRTYGGIINIM
jgi:hypothetical protein